MTLRRPMVGTACAVVGGMGLASTGLFPIGLFFFAALFLIFLCFVFPRNHASTSAAFLMVAMVAACRFMVAGSEVSGISINQFRDRLPRRNIGIVGRVSGVPGFHPYRTSNRGAWTFPIRIEGIRESNDWKKCRGVVDVYIVGSVSDRTLRYGQRILLEGELDKKHFPGGNAMEFKVPQGGEISILSDALRFSPVALGRAWRESASMRLEAGIEKMPEQQAVLKALVLGYRKEIPPDLFAQFGRTGTVHIFAISGLHVGIVGLLLSILLKSVGIPRDWFGVWLLPLLFIYVVSTGMKSSAIRALAMAGVFVLAPLFRCKPDIPSSVAFAGILLLLFQPLEFMSAGFVFSFTVVVFIVMVYSRVPKHLLQGGWLRCYSISLVITSVAASLASIPLAALFFGMFSPIALLGNLLVVPLTFCIVLSGWLSILLPVASSIFNHAAVVFTNLLLGSVGWLDRLPGSSWQVAPPPLLSIVVWYGCLIYVFAHATKQWQRWIAMLGAGCAILLAVLA